MYLCTCIFWLVKFNPLKTETVLFTLKNMRPFPNLFFDYTILQFVEDHKHLSITFSSNGQWHTHIESIENTSAKILGIMCKFKYTLSRDALNHLLKHTIYYPLYCTHYQCGMAAHKIPILFKINKEKRSVL